MIGREDSQAFGEGQREELRWIGKPWRRVELLTHRYFYRGEECSRTRDLILHVGLRRVGLAATLTFTHTDCLDYSEERP